MKNWFILGLFVLTSNCALGPLVSHETARTVGESKHEMVGGLGNGGVVAKWNYGVTENFDLGLHYETLNPVGLRAKYAFLNNKEGWSLAGAFGYGSGFGSSHYYVDLMASHLVGKWEPYGTLRLVQMETDEKQITILGSEFTLGRLNFNYSHLVLGTRYWFSDRWLLSMELSRILLDGSVSPVIYSAALGYRF